MSTIQQKAASSYTPDKQGYYGKFGGAYIPEMLYPNVEELRTRYLEIMHEASFQKEYNALLKDYVGRPSPLYLARRLSNKYNTGIYLKREDLNHTGAHKINNSIGQILLAQRLGKKRIIAETGASSPADIGKVMGAATKQLAGQADGKTISATVKELLSK